MLTHECMITEHLTFHGVVDEAVFGSLGYGVISDEFGGLSDRKDICEDLYFN